MNNKSKYVLDLFRKIYKVPVEVNIALGADSNAGVNIISSGVLERSEFSIDHSNLIWKEWLDQKIPFLFDFDDNEIIVQSKNRVTIKFDIVASAFYFLSGWQEKEYFENSENDGRFPYKNSIQYKLGIPHIPVVNYYFDIIRYAVELHYNIKLFPLITGNVQPTAFLSHDIDSTDKAWLRGSYHELRKGRINSVINLIYRKFLLGNDAWFNLEEILEYERENGVYSTFFFIPRKGKKDGIKNADYDINNEKFQQAIEKIRKKEFEVGLHGSIGTHSNSNRLIEDLQKVNHNVLGNRFHFLKFDITKTPKTLENAGIKYDSTLGFSEHYGFRNGICFPFYLYDIEQDEPLNVIEIPLMFMDATLRQKNYLNLNKTEIIDSAEKLIQEIKKFNGIFSILWHNTYFSEYKYSGWKEILDELINLSKSNGLTFLTGKEIAENFENQLQEY